MKEPRAPGSRKSHGALRSWTREERRRFPGKKFAGGSRPSSLMANKEVEFREAASQEFEAAFDWYLERSAGAAARFAREVNRAIGSIAEAPQRWPTGSHGTRKFLLRRFPFAVVYRELPSFKCWQQRTGTGGQATGKIAEDFGDHPEDPTGRRTTTSGMGRPRFLRLAIS